MGKTKGKVDGGGLIIFQDVSQAIQAEKIVRAGGYDVKLIAPPPKYRMGCDLGLEINLVERAGIARLLQEKDAPYMEILSTTEGATDMCLIVKTTDYGDWLMIKAGNMKLAYEKATGMIVNTSGGGCPDIPYLHAEMLDRKLDEAPKPADLGYTLCALMLDRALEEALVIWKGGK